MVSNEAIVTFREMGDRRPKDDSICDLVQQRWLNHHTLNQSWTNIYCYVHPATVYDCSAMEVKYIKFIDFDRHLAFLDDSELICSLSSASSVPGILVVFLVEIEGDLLSNFLE